MFTVGNSNKLSYLISDEWDYEDLCNAISQISLDLGAPRRINDPLYLTFSNVIAGDHRYMVAFHEYLENLDTKIVAHVHGNNGIAAAIMWKCSNVISICNSTTTIQNKGLGTSCENMDLNYKSLHELLVLETHLYDFYQKVLNIGDFAQNTPQIFRADEMLELGLVDQKEGDEH